MGSMKKAIEDWKKWCKNNPDFIPLEEYKGANTPIKVKHGPCEKIYMKRPNDLKRGHGCVSCSKKNNLNWKKRRVSTERLVSKDKLLKLLGKDYDIISSGQEFRSTEKIDIRHNLCNSVFQKTPLMIEYGGRCPNGLCKSGKTNSDFILELSQLNPTVIPMETYKGSDKKMLFKCDKCGYKWEAFPYSILQGHGCPACWNNSKSLTNEEFLRRVESMDDGQEYQFLSPYVKNQEKVMVKHLICGNEYKVTPWHFLHGRRCPFCQPAIKNVSDKEKDLRAFVEGLRVKVEYNVRNIIPPYELDIYCPESKVAIEFNGTYWHSGEKKEKDYHYKKSVMCEEKGIRLIHVFEYEWDSPRQNPILKNIISHALGKTEIEIYARKCRIEERESASMREFFENNNIQGFRGGQKAVCLIYQDKVVMSYIIGRCFFAKKPSYEIIRGATLLGCTVVGGASKLWNYITNKWDDLPILYYIDFNYFNGSSMLSLKGLEYIGTTPSFKNWWRVHWKTGERNVIRNREPMHHKEVIEAQKRGLGWPIYNAGTKTYIYSPKK